MKKKGQLLKYGVFKLFLFLFLYGRAFDACCACFRFCENASFSIFCIFWQNFVFIRENYHFCKKLNFRENHLTLSVFRENICESTVIQILKIQPVFQAESHNCSCLITLYFCINFLENKYIFSRKILRHFFLENRLTLFTYCWLVLPFLK